MERIVEPDFRITHLCEPLCTLINRKKLYANTFLFNFEHCRRRNGSKEKISVMKIYQSLFIVVLFSLLGSCSNSSKKADNESASSDSSALAKVRLIDSVKHVDENSSVAVQNVEITPIPDEYKFLTEGSWLARNCFPSAKFDFSDDMTVRVDDVDFATSVTITGDTLHVFSDSGEEAYKIVSHSGTELGLRPLKPDAKFLHNCGVQGDLYFDLDKLIDEDSIKTSDFVGVWEMANILNLKMMVRLNMNLRLLAQQLEVGNFLKGNWL